MPTSGICTPTLSYERTAFADLLPNQIILVMNISTNHRESILDVIPDVDAFISCGYDYILEEEVRWGKRTLSDYKWIAIDYHKGMLTGYFVK